MENEPQTVKEFFIMMMVLMAAMGVVAFVSSKIV